MDHLAALEAEIREVVSRAAGSTPPELTYSLFRQFADTGYRYGYEHPYFERRGQLVAAGAAALFEVRREGRVGEDILSVLADELWRVCDEYTWALPAHVAHARDGDVRRCVDLFAAETAHTLAEIVAFVGKQLPEPVVERVRSEVLDRVLIPFADDPRPIEWESYTHNWLAVCAGAIGMAALALFSDGDERLTRILERVRPSMERYLAHFPDDGGCSEGMDYWVYGFGYFVYFAEAWRERGGPDLLDDAKVREIAAFPARVGFADGTFPAFSDGSETAALPSGLVSRLVERLGSPVPYLPEVPSFASDFCHRWAHIARNIEWTDPALLGRAAGPHESFLPDLQWIVALGESFEFAAKGGHNDEMHNHLDVGHFIVRAYGETLLADLGAGEYNAEYFGPKRYLDIHPAAEGHSIPIIDGRMQLPGRERAATVVRHEAGLLELDLTGAYDIADLASVHRRFEWDATALAMTDWFEAHRRMPVDELFVSRIRPEVEAERVVWEGEKAVAVMTLQQPAAPQLEVVETTGHRGEPESVYRCRIRWIIGPGDSALAFKFTVKES